MPELYLKLLLLRAAKNCQNLNQQWIQYNLELLSYVAFKRNILYGSEFLTKSIIPSGTNKQTNNHLKKPKNFV